MTCGDTTPCGCPIHDQVAELLGIVSTTGRDFRPAAERVQAFLDGEDARAFLLPGYRYRAGDELRLAELDAVTVNDVRHPPRPRKLDPLKELRANYEIRRELARQEQEVESFGGDTATVGYHRPQPRQTHRMPSCKVCSSSRVREVVGGVNQAYSAVCGDCGHDGHVWMGQY